MSDVQEQDAFTVYVVTAGQFDSYHDEAAFATRELAEAYIAAVHKQRNRHDHVNQDITEMLVHRTLIPDQYDDMTAD